MPQILGSILDQENQWRIFLDFSILRWCPAIVGIHERERSILLFVGRPGLDPGTLGLKGHRVLYSLFIRFREPHIHRVLRSVRSMRSVAIEKC